ncbi:MAG: carboxypeptidase-like regulatory domain-containing protein [bacterium]
MKPRRNWWSATMLLAVTLLFSTPASAQLLRGRALLPSDSLPAAGAVIMLIDSTGAIVGRALADERGAFTLHAPAGGSYQLRGLRIGFRPSTSDRFIVAANGVTTHNLSMVGSAVVLAATHVVADSRCASYRDSATMAYLAWEEARKALLSSSLARASSVFEMDLVKFEQRFSASGDALISNTETETSGRTTKPFTAFAEARLASDGYVTRDETGVLYAAPDEEVLLSDSFAETHCMRLEVSSSAQDTIVLAFTPTPARTLPDVAGRLVIERATGRLRRLEFSYVNVTREEEKAHAGGTINFRMLPTGSWIVDRWALRLPIFERRIVRAFKGGSTINTSRAFDELRQELIAVQIAGGEVQRIAQGTRVIWTGPQAQLLGRILDSAGTPVANAGVTVLGANSKATSDRDGWVRGPMVRPGRKQLRVGTPVQDSLVLPPVIADVDVVSDSSGPGWLVRVPTRAQSISAVCPRQNASLHGLLRGTTRSRGGERLANASVKVAWSELDIGAVTAPSLSTKSSSIGDYLICGIPLDRLLTITLRDADKDIGEVKLILHSTEGMTVKDLQLGTVLSSKVP